MHSLFVADIGQNENGPAAGSLDQCGSLPAGFCILITVLGYPLAFAASAVAPVLATPLIPDARAERDRL